MTVREETMYGDAAEYQAVYIAPGDNRTELTLEYMQDDNSYTAVFSASGTDVDITTDSFRII